MGYALVLVCIASLVVIYIGAAGMFGKLPRNRWVGLRTAKTSADDEAWARGHRAGGPLLVFGGVAAFSASLAFAPFAIAGRVGDNLALAVVLVCAGAIVGSAFSATMAANAAAARPPAPPAPTTPPRRK